MSQPVLVLSFALAFGALTTALIAGFVSATTRPVRAALLAALAVLTAAVSFAILGSGLRVNFTSSMPLGIYWLEALPISGVERGMFVAVCAPQDVAEQGRRSGYLSTGPCPHGTELLLKAVAGVTGDDVTVSAWGVAINGRLLPHSRPVAFDRSGRRMSPWPAGRYHLGREQVWLYADNDRSWDSRYWGPTPVANVMARAVPLLVVSGVPLYEREAGQRCGALPWPRIVARLLFSPSTSRSRASVTPSPNVCSLSNLSFLAAFGSRDGLRAIPQHIWKNT